MNAKEMVDRFRNGEPMSRGEREAQREAVHTTENFWWEADAEHALDGGKLSSTFVSTQLSSSLEKDAFDANRR